MLGLMDWKMVVGMLKEGNEVVGIMDCQMGNQWMEVGLLEEGMAVVALLH